MKTIPLSSYYFEILWSLSITAYHGLNENPVVTIHTIHIGNPK